MGEPFEWALSHVDLPSEIAEVGARACLAEEAVGGRQVTLEGYQVDVQLNGVAHAFPPGHRLRVALSTSYWPLAWPPPEPVRLEIFLGSSHLTLPVRPADTDQVSPLPFEEPEGAEPASVTQVVPGRHHWTVTRDLIDYRSALDVVNDLGVLRLDDIDLEVSRRADETYSSVADDFGSACGETTWTMRFRRKDWEVRAVTKTILTSTKTSFVLHAELDAYEGAVACSPETGIARCRATLFDPPSAPGGSPTRAISSGVDSVWGMSGTLPEELLLIAYDQVTGRARGDSTELDCGLAGAVLAELALAGRIDVVNGRVKVRDPTPVGDPVIGAALERIAGERKPRKPDWWVGKLGSGVRDQLLGQLTDRGVLRLQPEKVLWVFPVRRFPAIDSRIESAARVRLEYAVVHGGEPDARTASLACLLNACGQARRTFPGLDRRQLKTRVGQLCEGQWTSDAVRKAIQATQTASAPAG